MSIGAEGLSFYHPIYLSIFNNNNNKNSKLLRLKSGTVRRFFRLKENMTLALLSEIQVCKPLCRLHRYAWFDNGSHVPCKYTIGFGLPFFCTTPNFNSIKVIFNRLFRFAITWQLHYSKTGEARQAHCFKAY